MENLPVTLKHGPHNDYQIHIKFYFEKRLGTREVTQGTVLLCMRIRVWVPAPTVAVHTCEPSTKGADNSGRWRQTISGLLTSQSSQRMCSRFNERYAIRKETRQKMPWCGGDRGRHLATTQRDVSHQANQVPLISLDTDTRRPWPGGILTPASDRRNTYQTPKESLTH